jgi:hypothetical protein
LNPGRWTTTTGTPGRLIPNRVAGVAEAMPFPDGVADVITVESTPLRAGAAAEIARVIKPGGRIRLVHPTAYALGTGAHQRVIDAVGGCFRQSERGGVVTTLIIAPGKP